MKYILLFAFIGVFFWIALIPPEGMSKMPAVDVQLQYSEGRRTAKLSVDARAFGAEKKDDERDGPGS